MHLFLKNVDNSYQQHTNTKITIVWGLYGQFNYVMPSKYVECFLQCHHRRTKSGRDLSEVFAPPWPKKLMENQCVF